MFLYLHLQMLHCGAGTDVVVNELVILQLRVPYVALLFLIHDMAEYLEEQILEWLHQRLCL